MNNALNILTGGGEEKNELKALYLEQEFEGWNIQQLVGNAGKNLFLRIYLSQPISVNTE